MALIKWADGFGPRRGTTGGSTFYVAGGRSFVRQRPTPVKVLSSAVLDEVAAVVRGSREWAYRLPESLKQEFDVSEVLGLGGMPLEIAVWSWIWEVLEEVPLPIFIPIENEPVCPINVAMSGRAESLVVEFPAVAGWSGGAAWVAATPPLAKGRRPRLDRARIIARGLSVPGSHSLGDAYVGRFGRFPEPGSSVLIASRAASLVDQAVAGLCEVFVEVSGGVSGSFEPNPITVKRLSAGTASVLRMCSSSPGASGWFLNWLGPGGLFFFHSNPVPNCVSDSGKVEALAAAGTYDGVLHGLNDGTGEVLDVPVTVIVVD